VVLPTPITPSIAKYIDSLHVISPPVSGEGGV
jgi:hypothetical protein